jgi:hypothetical protein
MFGGRVPAVLDVFRALTRPTGDVFTLIRFVWMERKPARRRIAKLSMCPHSAASLVV